jgi:hypothetical protein
MTVDDLDTGTRMIEWGKKKNLPLPRLEKEKKEINTPDSHLVPHGSTKGASSGLASKFGMGFGALRSL